MNIQINKEKMCQVRRWALYKYTSPSKPGREYAVLSSEGCGGVVVIGVDKNKNIAIIKIYRFAVSDYCWEFVKGCVEQGEDFVEAGVREFKEEIGISDDPKKVVYLGQIYPDTALIDHDVGAVFVEYDDFTKYDVWGKLDGSYEEIFERKFVNVEQFENMIKDGLIKDNYTLSTYMLAKSKGLI